MLCDTLKKLREYGTIMDFFKYQNQSENESIPVTSIMTRVGELLFFMKYPIFVDLQVQLFFVLLRSASDKLLLVFQFIRSKSLSRQKQTGATLQRSEAPRCLSQKNDSRRTKKRSFSFKRKIAFCLHSDRGFQYTSHAFKEADITQSMSRVGKCIDNDLMESFLVR